MDRETIFLILSALSGSGGLATLVLALRKDRAQALSLLQAAYEQAMKDFAEKIKRVDDLEQEVKDLKENCRTCPNNLKK